MVLNVDINGLVHCSQDQLSTSLLPFSGDSNSVACAHTQGSVLVENFFVCCLAGHDQ